MWLYIIYFQIFIHMSVNVILKNYFILTAKYFNFETKRSLRLYLEKSKSSMRNSVYFCYSTYLFVVRNFKHTDLSKR